MILSSSSASTSSRCRRRGRTSGCARTRRATSRRPGSTPPAAGSTCITRAGASVATDRSSTGCCPSPISCHGYAGDSLGRCADGDEPNRERVLAAAVRLLDIGMFRVGSEQYADEDSGIGLATIRKAQVRDRRTTRSRSTIRAREAARRQVIDDPDFLELIGTLKRRRAGPDELLAYRDGRRWRDVRSDDINEYLNEQLGDEFSAKDFRTWNATVMAAVTLAAMGGTRLEDRPQAGDQPRRGRRVGAAWEHARGRAPAYIDPRVFDRYLSGWTIAAALERIPELDVADDRVRTRWSARSSTCWSTTPIRRRSSTSPPDVRAARFPTVSLRKQPERLVKKRLGLVEASTPLLRPTTISPAASVHLV